MGFTIFVQFPPFWHWSDAHGSVSKWQRNVHFVREYIFCVNITAIFFAQVNWQPFGIKFYIWVPKVNIPILTSHMPLVPPYPNTHLHSNLPARSMQVPLFWHGSELHWLLSVWRNCIFGVWSIRMNLRHYTNCISKASLKPFILDYLQ